MTAGAATGTLAATRISRDTLGRVNARIILAALRDGRYGVRPEARLRDTGMPPLFDLMPDDAKASEPGVRDPDALPIIRLRSMTPTIQDFDPIDAAASVLTFIVDRASLVDRAAWDRNEDDLARTEAIRTAVLAATLTRGMAAMAAQDRHVCAVTTPMPWSTAHAVVIHRPKGGGFRPVAATPVPMELAAMLETDYTISSDSYGMTGIPISTIESATTTVGIDDLPDSMEAIRTLASIQGSRQP